MARGWESKSVEAQIDMAENNSHRADAVRMLNAREQELLRKRETILLSRTRVVRELKSAQNPRYKGILNKALADLDAQLASFASI
jgi:hypothetical protein